MHFSITFHFNLTISENFIPESSVGIISTPPSSNSCSILPLPSKFMTSSTLGACF